MNKDKNRYKYKIICWNINIRSGVRGNSSHIPSFVKEEIVSQEADIIVLTEFFYCMNAKEFLSNTFTSNGYDYETTQNTGANEVVIAWKKGIFQKRNVDKMAISQLDNNVPNYLRVDLEDWLGEVFTVIGSRIRMVDYVKRRDEMQFIINRVKQIQNPIIIAGDFNNNRRLTIEQNWNLNVIDTMLQPNGFVRHTPEGQSIYQEKAEYAYEFPEDHFMTRDLIIEIEAYDREFVYRDPMNYPWGKDFQIYDYNMKRQRSILSCNPDHAILKGWFQKKWDRNEGKNNGSRFR